MNNDKGVPVMSRVAGWPQSPVFLPIMFSFLFAGPAAIQGYLKPYFATVHGLNPMQAAQPLFTLYFVFAVCRYLAGHVMHALGRNRCIVLGALGYFGFPVAMALCTRPAHFVLYAAVMGVAAALLWTAGSTHVLDASIKKRLGRASGILYSAVAAGQVFGVLTMGTLSRNKGAHDKYWWIFGCAILFGATGVIVSTFIPKVSGSANRPRLHYVLQFYRNPSNWVMPLVACLASMPYGFVLGVLNKTADRLAPIWGVTLILALYYGTNCAISSAAGRISDRLGRWQTFVGCLVAPGLLLTVIGLFEANRVLVCIAAMVLSCPHGGLSPVMMAWVGDLSTQETRSTVHACAFSWRDLGVGLAILLGGTLQELLPKEEMIFLAFGLFFVVAGAVTFLAHWLWFRHAKGSELIAESAGVEPPAGVQLPNHPGRDD